MIKPNPFTPQSGWEPKVFGGRHNEVDQLHALIDEAAHSRAAHAVVLGDWGIGKTSLLKQVKKIAQEKSFLAAMCPISQFSAKETSRDGIRLIMEEIMLGIPKLQGAEEFFDSLAALGVSVTPLRSTSRQKNSFQPQVELARFLRRLWDYLDTDCVVILLDDIQNFATIPSVIDILRSTLSKEEIINETRYMFVFAGTTDIWDDFVDKHDPIGRFFRKRIYLDKFTEAEASKIIKETLRGSGVAFDPDIAGRIYAYTQGHPYELQLLCSHLYEAQLEGEVTAEQWDTAFIGALRELGRDYFDSMFRKSSDRERAVLEVLAEHGGEMAIRDIQKTIWSRHKKFPLDSVKNFLYRSEVKGLVKRTGRGMFKIWDLMLASYIKNLS